MVVKIEVMQIASPKHFHLRNDKGDLKGEKKKKRMYTFEKHRN